MSPLDRPILLPAADLMRRPPVFVLTCLSIGVFLSATSRHVVAQEVEGGARGVLIDDVDTTEFPIGKSDSKAESAELPPEIAKWEEEIRKLEMLDETEPDPADAVLFIGSSSIRLWKTIARDMAPYRTIRRGYGGAKFSDLAHYASRVITPHEYRGLVLFVANDVSGGDSDHTPDQVRRWLESIIDVSKRHQSEAPIFIVEVTPTPKRYEAWPAIADLNARLRRVALTEPNVYYVATAEHYLDADKVPRASLFTEDRLHQNEEGYERWASLIRRRLDEVFRMLAGAR